MNTPVTARTLLHIYFSAPFLTPQKGPPLFPPSIVRRRQGSEFLGPGWYCKDRLAVKKTELFVGELEAKREAVRG